KIRDAVLQERSWELCYEGHRRWDLLRAGKYITRLQAFKIPAAAKKLLYPIPQNERDVNVALTENSGY
ncbi:MAG: RagB/SusD family nutrient uptake outer membrane protein, partial [Chitinophagaceae bacterium]